MTSLTEDAIVRQSLLLSIEREELLLKKYEKYHEIENEDLRELLKEFRETACDHMDILREKMRKLDQQVIM
ncbi:MAG: hypothetical protein ACM3PP_12210 [Candidatus Saccharibacteria bacterium]